MNMKTLLIKLLCIVALCGVATSARSLTIQPTFDASITGDPKSAAIMAAINTTIQLFQSNYTDNLTVRIYFQKTNAGLGASSTLVGSFPYSNYIAALRSNATTKLDTYAISKLPYATNDPVFGSNMIRLSTAIARTLGIYTNTNTFTYDSTLSFNTSIMNFTRPSAIATNYDMQAVVAHEINEVLGWITALNYTNIAGPPDLFRYTTNLARTSTTNGDNAYFSVDATNLWARFNMVVGGDYHDWWSASATGWWAPTNITPHQQVQDAFGRPGTMLDMGTNEIAALDVIGYTPAATITQPPPVLGIVNNRNGTVTVQWSISLSGYSLQERTNLYLGSWGASAAGVTNNMAIIPAAPIAKFYRLKKSSGPGSASDSALDNMALADSATITPGVVEPQTNGPFQAVTHYILPVQP
jgi:hypothetical protein